MTKSTNLTEITTNVTVGMDEVVSVFISQYETNLFDKKDQLSGKIKQAKAALKGLDASLVSSINRSDYEMTNSVIGIVSKVEDVLISWKNGRVKVSTIGINVDIKSTDKSDDYRSSMSKTVHVLITKQDEDEYETLTSELSSLTEELTEVMQLVKSVSRKERQVRGEISKRKLQESGLSSLLEDDSMLALVQL
jgi:NTP pyrophosphatase (non-canonical NTP hydrolase)